MKPKQIRKRVLELALKYNHGHIAPALSIIEILVSLYSNILKDNDIFILSKGHGCLSWYAILQELGLRPDASKGHPDIDPSNGIFCSTGSLGHGLPIGVGAAFANKLMNKDGRVYVLMSDGECQEGSTWESLLFANQHKLDNIVIVIDINNLQALGETKDILNLEPLKDKFKSFGCEVVSVDGHNVENLTKAFLLQINKPLVILARTIKGKGISYMEGRSEWHNRIPNSEELKIAYEELK